MRCRFIAASAALLMIAGPAIAQDSAATVGDAAREADFFEVVGVAGNDLLNVRATASAAGMIIGRLPNGSRVKNQGCREVNKYRWCKVQDVNDPKLIGWAPGRYLKETSIDGGQVVTGEDGETIAVAITGEVPCARYYGQPMRLCQARVERSEDGEAAVTMIWPDGGERTIRFSEGKPQNADSPDPMKFTREADLNMIRIGKGERFEIPDALPFGG